jgi:4-amino-4-deoxy-L-arabinose transferase-like glycosyltransferase
MNRAVVLERAALLIVVAVAAVVALATIFERGLWEDEAFNLTVPINLVAGLGYSSDGTLSGSLVTAFDPRISTGPIVLLPIAAGVLAGVDPVIAGRLVAAVFFAALVAVTALLGRRLGGPWGAVAAVAMLAVFDGSQSLSPIHAPTDILGEMPAAALLAGAALVLPRRPRTAAVLIGLAALAKTIALLAAPALFVVLFIVASDAAIVRRIVRAAAATALAAVPVVAWEVIIFISLGPTGYIDHLRLSVAFIRTGGQQGYETSLADKAEVLFSSWHGPWQLAVFVTLLLIGIVVAVTVARIRRDGRSGLRAFARNDVVLVLLFTVLGLLAFLGWWMTARHTPAWVRHPAPGLLAFAPAIVAFAIGRVHAMLRGRRTPARLVAAGASVALALSAGVMGFGAARTAFEPTGWSLATQRDAAAQIAEVGAEQIAIRWGSLVSPIVLAGSHVALLDAPPENIVDAWQLTSGGTGSGCRPIDLGEGYALCPPDAISVQRR